MIVTCLICNMKGMLKINELKEGYAKLGISYKEQVETVKFRYVSSNGEKVYSCDPCNNQYKLGK